MIPRISDRWYALGAALVCLLFLFAAVTTGGSQEAASKKADVPTVDDVTAPDDEGVATVGNETYESLQTAVAAAEPGETIRISGRFDESVVVETPNVTLTATAVDAALLHGDAEGDVLTIEASNVTVDSLWVQNSGYKAEGNDAGIWVDGNGTTIRNSRVTESTFGIWLDSVSDARIANTTIVGREEITPLTERGNGIQVHETTESRILDNRITDVRDGIYYSFASEVLARNNTMWDLRYGVHYMYSDDCWLVGNAAIGNDAGYALMVSKRLTLRDNVAIDNDGRSGHGILVKSIDDTRIADNTLIGNRNGLYVYNSLNNTLTGNLMRENDVGVYLAAGSVRETVHHNAFVANDRPVEAVVGEQLAWNESAGNYWADATTVDLNDDGISELRHQPAGSVEKLTREQPAATVFARSPAFDAVRRAESTVPLIESPGVVDYRPLTDPPRNATRDDSNRGKYDSN